MQRHNGSHVSTVDRMRDPHRPPPGGAPSPPSAIPRPAGEHEHSHWLPSMHATNTLGKSMCNRTTVGAARNYHSHRRIPGPLVVALMPRSTGSGEPAGSAMQPRLAVGASSQRTWTPHSSVRSVIPRTVSERFVSTVTRVAASGPWRQGAYETRTRGGGGRWFRSARAGQAYGYRDPRSLAVPRSRCSSCRCSGSR
jgi:hypothetical protein